jgi:hypothetical protein
VFPDHRGLNVGKVHDPELGWLARVPQSAAHERWLRPAAPGEVDPVLVDFERSWFDEVGVCEDGEEDQHRGRETRARHPRARPAHPPSGKAEEHKELREDPLRNEVDDAEAADVPDGSYGGRGEHGDRAEHTEIGQESGEPRLDRRLLRISMTPQPREEDEGGDVQSMERHGRQQELLQHARYTARPMPR